MTETLAPAAIVQDKANFWALACKTNPIPGDYLVPIEGADAEHDVRDVTFANVSIASEKLTAESVPVQMGTHVQNVRFRPETK